MWYQSLQLQTVCFDLVTAAQLYCVLVVFGSHGEDICLAQSAGFVSLQLSVMNLEAVLSHVFWYKKVNHS